MICPVCKSDMIVVERNRIELDHCPSCGGTWFDAGELELLLSSVGVSDARPFLAGLLENPKAKITEGTRKCPICGRSMSKRVVGQPQILLDICPHGHGMWFDGGELNSLLSQISNAPFAGRETGKKISEFLGDVFRAGPAGKQG